MPQNISKRWTFGGLHVEGLGIFVITGLILTATATSALFLLLYCYKCYTATVDGGNLAPPYVPKVLGITVI